MGTIALPIVEEPRYSTAIGRPIDNTALVQYNCPKRYLYGMVWHRRREGAPTPALGYGGSWHHAMEGHYKYRPPLHLTPNKDTTEVTYRKLREDILTDIYDQVETFVVHNWEDHQSPDDHRTLRRLLLDYEKFLKVYGLPWEGEDKTVGWPDAPLVELSGEIAIPGARHPYAFKIDRIFRMQGQLYVDDHKTSSRQINFNEYTLDNQMMGYAVSAWLLTGEVIAGVRIRGVVVHKNETLFEHRTIPFGKERLLQWMRNYDAQLMRLEQSHQLLASGADEDVAFPNNWSICAGKYGMCQYASICSLPPEVRHQALAEDFQIVPWNPLEQKEVADV